MKPDRRVEELTATRTIAISTAWNLFGRIFPLLIAIAAGLLTQGVNIATIAADVGYGSEAAFSRAFKKLVGVSPSGWRARPR